MYDSIGRGTRRDAAVLKALEPSNGLRIFMGEQQTSGLGVASVVIALAGVGTTVSLFVAGVFPVDGSYTEQRVEHAFYWAAMVIAPTLHVVGLIFGATGLLQTRQKAAAVVGVILNTLPLVFALISWALLIVLVLIILVAGPIWR